MGGLLLFLDHIIRASVNAFMHPDPIHLNKAARGTLVNQSNKSHLDSFNEATWLE
jgi:hypothetical protein